jgi:hypothetical protein
LVVAVLVFFAAILQAGQSFLNDRPWFWGSALLAAAALNWKIGRHFNRKRLASIRSARLKERLLYRAPHRFMSVPMETFSIALVGLAFVLIIWGIANPATDLGAR